MLSTHEQILVLELFNEKASKLYRSGFIKSLTGEEGLKINFHKTPEGELKLSVTRKGVTDEEIDAFTLTFRFFIQNNDAISFHNIAAIYENPHIKKLYKDCFKSARDYLNEILRADNFLGIKYEDKYPTNGHIVDAFIYGSLAHAKPDKRKKLQDWAQDTSTASLFEAGFSVAVTRILEIIIYVSSVNEGAIKDLKSLKD